MRGAVAAGGDRRSPAGFTLLEILVAVAILGLAYLAVLENFSQSMRNIARVERSDQRNFAAELAMDQELMAIPGQLEVEPPAGEVYVKGRLFQLLQTEGEDTGGRAVLLLERVP